ncbi:MAG: hypothetical protein RKO66_15350 [Candidatus Contendobacter sp.]|nr:hypothetical protein [Candidatus Contendobacter sp.]
MSLSTYPQIEIDREAMMEAIYRLQVDLRLLADWLARESEPVMTENALWLLVGLGQDLARLAPSTRRH